MLFTERDLDTISALARVTITPEEKQKMLTDMQAILGYISEINTVTGDIKGRDVTAKESNHYNVVRDDVVTNVDTLHDVLLNEAPATEDGYIKVAQVLK